jgi:sulfonate transport system substrate-binding protein
MQSHRRFRPQALGALLAISAACALSPNIATAQDTLRIGYLKVGHLTPMLLVPQYMKSCGVQAKLTEFVRYADARTAMLSDSVDVSAISPADLLIALAQGSNKIVGLTGVASSPKYLVVKKGVDIDNWDQLKDKRVGIAPGSAVWFQWAATLAEKNIPYKTFTAVNIQGGGTAFMQALKRGDVDAVALWEPYESELVEDGTAYFSKNLRYDQSKSVGDELGMLAATRAALQNRRSDVECFLSSYEKSQDEMSKDPQLFATSYAKYTGLPLAVTGPSSKVIHLGGTLDLAQLQREATEFYKLKVIPKDVSAEVGKAWDPSLYKEAVAKLRK